MATLAIRSWGARQKGSGMWLVGGEWSVGDPRRPVVGIDGRRGSVNRLGGPPPTGIGPHTVPDRAIPLVQVPP